MTRPNELSRALRKRGCAIWPGAFGPSAVEPVAHLASGVAIGVDGLNSYAPPQQAGEITPMLDRPDVLAVLETVVGAGGHVEALSGNLSDESRRAMRGRARGSRPGRIHARRTFAEAPE